MPFVSSHTLTKHTDIQSMETKQNIDCDFNTRNRYNKAVFLEDF